MLVLGIVLIIQAQLRGLYVPYSMPRPWAIKLEEHTGVMCLVVAVWYWFKRD